MVRIGFHGAAETVTGSRHLLQIDKKRILVDCGVFQGPPELRERNWQPFAIEPRFIDAVVVTHAHMDHIGWLPRLVAQGYRGPIYATKATVALARISLLDSGRLQEEDARHAAKRGEPSIPLYTEAMSQDALKLFEPVAYNTMKELPGGATLRYFFAGHILGSAFAEIYFPKGERIMMSGDLGRFNTPVIRDPTTIEYAEYLTIESTYGDRRHSMENPLDALEGILKAAFDNGSAVVVPSFAIGRTQELLYMISVLQEQNRLPRIPIFLDSPMAGSVTEVYKRSVDEHDEEMEAAAHDKIDRLEPRGLEFIRDRNASKALNARRGPLVIIAGSGMATGGRVVHHLLQRLGDPETTVLFTGYQAVGTLGREILEGAPKVRIHKHEVMVRASVRKLNSLSAHADQCEIMHWLGKFKQPPKKTFIVHGEPPAQAALLARIQKELGWDAVIPRWKEEFELG